MHPFFDEFLELKQVSHQQWPNISNFLNITDDSVKLEKKQQNFEDGCTLTWQKSSCHINYTFSKWAVYGQIIKWGVMVRIEI